MKEFDDLKEIAASATDDVLKFDGGNKAAGVRVRKVMQDAIKAAKTVRSRIIEARAAQEKAEVVAKGTG